VKVSGFSFIREGVLLGYPFVESLRSLLPLVDEFILAVGESDADDTLERLRALNEPKLKLVPTRWNEHMADRGFVYAQQKMIAHYHCGGDWAFYLEGDEVLHEDDLPRIRAALERHHPDPRIEALAFDYHHYFGSPHWRAIGPGWYRRAVRLMRNDRRWFSPDGLFSLVMDRNRRGRYPRAALAGATIHHYGHVRRIAAMRAKNARVGRYWGHDHPLFEGYRLDPKQLTRYDGPHPALVRPWLAEAAETEFQPDPHWRPSGKDRRYRAQLWLEQRLGVDFSRRHFRLIPKVIRHD